MCGEVSGPPEWGLEIEEIKIFKDRWIPQVVVRMFNTPGWELSEDDVVAEIVWDTRWWNTSFLNVVFGGGDR